MENVDFTKLNALPISELLAILSYGSESLDQLQKRKEFYLDRMSLPSESEDIAMIVKWEIYYEGLVDQCQIHIQEKILAITGSPN